MSAPQLDEGAQLIKRAYQKLSTCRQIGMAVGSIPWTALDRWCTIREYTTAARDHFEAVIARIDGHYVSKANKR